MLRCPKSKRELVYFPRGDQNDSEEAAFLLCPASRLRYRIDAGVPVLLVEEATELDPRTVAGMLAKARELGLAVPPETP